MSKKFNLLLLHQSEDVHPRTWICIKGGEIKTTLDRLQEEIVKKQNWNQGQLYKKVAERFKCSPSTIRETCRTQKKYYPIPLIVELARLNREPKKFLNQLEQNIEYLKVNSASAKPTKAVHYLDESLSKILGAFMADGSLSIQITIASSAAQNLDQVKKNLEKLRIPYSHGESPSRGQHYINLRASEQNQRFIKSLILLSPQLRIQTHYNFELSDEYKDNVKAFNMWIKNTFGIMPFSLKQKRNAWRTSFSNKILARHLMCFFSIKPGPKAYTAFEPKIVQKSNLKTRKNFAKGVLMFDGCVSKQNKVLLSTKSKNLSNSIKQIWKKDGIDFGISFNKRRMEWNLFTTTKNSKAKLLNYFEKSTQKYKLIKWLSGDTTQAPVLKETLHLSHKKILKVIKMAKWCDVDFLQKHFNSKHSTICSYLKVLKAQKRIIFSYYPTRISDYVSENTTVFLKEKFHATLFKKIREHFKKDKNLASFLGISKSAVSSWRLKKNRVPIYVLKEICGIINLASGEISKNVEQTDRRIVEII